MEYADHIWDNQKQNLINKLENIQLDAVRIVTGGTRLTSHDKTTGFKIIILLLTIFDGIMGCRRNGLSEQWAVGIMGRRSNGLSE
jgi:hypothetical protein